MKNFFQNSRLISGSSVFSERMKLLEEHKKDKPIKLFIKRFTSYDELVIKKSLTYFEDAEKEPEFPLYKIDWKEIKNFFIKEFAKI